MLPKIDRCRQWGAAGIAIAILILSILSIAYAQNSEEPQQEHPRKTKPALESKIPQQPPASKKKGDYTIGVNVDLVMTYTSVFNKDNHFVSGLKQDNFKVYEDGIQQKITYFTQDDLPVSMGLLLDLSGSMRSKMEQVNKAALAFIKASNPQDEVFLIGFSDEAELLQDYTSDIDEITDALENTVVTGGTVAYDAIYLGVQKAHDGKKPKKAVVVITDGEDRDSYYKLDELLAKVQESDVQVFCIGFLNEIPNKSLFGSFSKSTAEKARDALIKISDETGGKAFFPDNITDIHQIVAEIASELRNQYSIGYFSSNDARDGTFRRVKIELSGSGISNSHARYRRGYFAPK
jgi:Ca-activated chloride channel homolog